MKPAINPIETLLEMVMETRSDDAAKAINAGKNSMSAMSSMSRLFRQADNERSLVQIW